MGHVDQLSDRARDDRQDGLRQRGSPLAVPAIAVAVVVVASLITPAGTAAVAARLGVLAVALAAFAASAVRPAVVAATTAVVVVLFETIATGRHGNVVWPDRADLVGVGVLVGAAVLGLTLTAAGRWAPGRSTRSSRPSPLHGPTARIPSQRRRGE